MFTALEKYKSTKSEYIDEQLKLLNNARKFYNGKEMIINAFKNDIFPFYHVKSEFEDENKNNIENENDFIDYKKFERLISLKKGDINDDLIRKHVQVQNLSTLFKKLLKLRNKKKSNNLTNVIKSRLKEI